MIAPKDRDARVDRSQRKFTPESRHGEQAEARREIAKEAEGIGGSGSILGIVKGPRVVTTTLVTWHVK